MFRANDYWISIVEMKGYRTDAEHILSEDERDKLAEFIATNPHYGDVIPGTGGVRKVRWGAKGKGKRGGARVIYYFRDLNMPVFLLAIYAKGEKANLTMEERAVVKELVESLVKQYKPRWDALIRLSAGTTE